MTHSDKRTVTVVDAAEKGMVRFTFSDPSSEVTTSMTVSAKEQRAHMARLTELGFRI